MKDVDTTKMSADDWDELNFPRPEVQDFDRVVERAISRRGFLGGVLAFGSGAAVMGSAFLKGSTAMAQGASRFPSKGSRPRPTTRSTCPKATAGTCSCAGAIRSSPMPRARSTRRPASRVEMSDRVFGENTDGMELFNIDGREILVVNSEYTNREVNLPHAEDGVPTGLDDVRILQNFQGVTVMEIAEGDDGWSVVIDSPYNRRITTTDGNDLRRSRRRSRIAADRGRPDRHDPRSAR
jgi:secreted PhoX family phosphatase